MMILEDPILPFGQWLARSISSGLTILLAVIVFGMLVGFLATSIRHGPGVAFFKVFRAIAASVGDISRISLRRIVALAQLAFKESIRSKVLVAFIVFIVGLLFAGWYLDVNSDNPGRLYISFVVQSSTYLVVLLGLFLSSFSLPNDMKHRTIYTVVTKPVLAWEIVLGRILGFAAIGTLLIAAMCVCSYFFVRRGLDHEHAVELASVRADSDSAGGYVGRTTRDSHLNVSQSGHRHEFQVDASGNGRTDTVRGHWHPVRRTEENGEAQFTVGAPRGQLQSRVPIGGRLRFLTREGKPGPPINVGKMWTYRGYIEGGTDGAAIWRFDDLAETDFPERLPLEMTIRVFRTHIGDIERPIQGQIVVQNPSNGLQSQPLAFGAREFEPQQYFIERQLSAMRPNGEVINADLYNDFVHEGSVDILVRCLEPGQYFGMAQADLYIRAPDTSFVVNFAKGFLGIWFQMLIVVGFGVMFSTFLNGPVAMLATMATVVMGFFVQFIVEVASGEFDGGGPIESMIRMIRQSNLMTPLEDTVGTTVVLGVDSGVMVIMQAVARVLPDFGSFSTIHLVAPGFHVPGALLAQHFVVTLVYLLVLSSAGYFLLKSKEIAA